ncbi:hypothetical protein AG1IA_05603 [Rhizoctonia solani AG-1 IA]|uniref:Secreted protein n=1 Tax=Thanatephorus cucumeris (strain AG1-IA) TaxID=983506 RepID=L8WUB2_THACA|nr:hypothetical protein AG1IA_05603 [Rhizoctonia solani AG-1 IA]
MRALAYLLSLLQLSDNTHLNRTTTPQSLYTCTNNNTATTSHPRRSSIVSPSTWSLHACRVPGSLIRTW